jgi:hypothetical protein
VWTANTDHEVEGNFSDRYTGQRLVHAPWPPDRPYDGGFAYNCMMLEVAAGQRHPPQVTLVPAPVGDKLERIYYGAEMVGDAKVKDEECSSKYCTLCEVAAPARKVWVRGLCPLSLFDRTYTYTIDEDGKPMYLGYHSSVIFYDEARPGWVWYDRKDNKSVAVSIAPEESLLLGVQTVDFAGVKDKCIVGPPELSRRLQVKVTTCTGGQFTCSDGQCVSMEERWAAAASTPAAGVTRRPTASTSRTRRTATWSTWR